MENMNETYLIIIVFICFSLAKEKKIRPAALWVIPALFASYVFQTVTQTFDADPRSFLLGAIGLVAGAAIGALRGRLDLVRRNPHTGEITSKSPLSGIAIFLAVMGLRMVVDLWNSDPAMLALSNALLLTSFASICARRFINYTRYKNLLTQR